MNAVSIKSTDQTTGCTIRISDEEKIEMKLESDILLKISEIRKQCF